MLNQIRERIDNKIFTPLGIVVTFINKQSPIYNTRGDLTGYTSNPVQAPLVPLNFIKSQISYNPFGDLSNGESDFIVPFDTVIAQDTEFTFEGVDYVIKQIEEYKFPENVLKMFRAHKKLA